MQKNNAFMSAANILKTKFYVLMTQVIGMQVDHKKSEWILLMLYYFRVQTIYREALEEEGIVEGLYGDDIFVGWKTLTDKTFITQHFQEPPFRNFNIHLDKILRFNAFSNITQSVWTDVRMTNANFSHAKRMLLQYSKMGSSQTNSEFEKICKQILTMVYGHFEGMDRIGFCTKCFTDGFVCEKSLFFAVLPVRIPVLENIQGT